MPRRRQSMQSQASFATFYKRFKDARGVATDILEGTDWPQRARTAAQGLLETIENSPNIQGYSSNSNDTPADLKQAVDQFTNVLREVGTKLEKISLKYGTRKRGIRERIKYFTAMLREDRCDQILRDCRTQVNTASQHVREKSGAPEDLGPRTHVAQPAFPSTSNAVGGGHSTLRAEWPDPSAPSNGQNIIVSSAQQGSLAAVRRDEDVRPIAAPNSNATAYADGLHRQSNGSNTAGALQAPVSIISSPSQSPLEAAADETQPAAAQIPASNLPENRPKKGRRQGYLDVASKVFTSVEAVSGLIPIVGGYLGAAAKVGSTCVEMLQGMDSNDEAAQALQERTSRLSDILGQFKHQSFEPERATTTKLINIAEVQKERRELLACLGDGNYGAQDDAIENVVCHPGTRVEILARINGWVSGGKSSERLLWLKGMAGRGKSAVASTVGYKWKQEKASCALFHFRRGQTALYKRLICALARQLICNGSTEVREAILKAIRSNRDVATVPMEEQFRLLLTEPLRELEPDAPPVLLMVDALDECEDPDYVLRFIKVIARHNSSIPANIKFLVSSRPEDFLVRALQHEEWRTEDLDHASETANDIALFLQTGLTKTRTEHRLSEDWPPVGSVDSLTRFSQGLFQWAHTVIRYISERMPKRRLREVLDTPTGWAGLDDLYHQVLTKAIQMLKIADKEDQLLYRVLGIIVVAPYPVSMEVIAYLCADHELLAGGNWEEGIELLYGQILADLRSILSISTSSSDPVQFMHTSIRDL
ncbi:hypothetical protein FRC01_002093, partial [Tulasnella sp. 417]